MSVIPYPDDLSQMKLLLKTSRSKNNQFFKYTQRDQLNEKVNEVLYTDGLDKPVKIRNLGESYSDLLNAYSITRAMVQSNEACNKVWATVELLHAFSDWNQGYPDLMFSKKPTIKRSLHTPLCDKFDIEFCGGTVIPTLYYAQLSALISLMSSYGCVSIRDQNLSRYYNLVRTKTGWKIFHRRKFIYDLCGEKATSSWHGQLNQILRGLRERLVHFPPVNVDLISTLAQARNQRHYEIMSSLDAKYSRGIDDYFSYLPDILETIHLALFIIRRVYGKHGLAGFTRFTELYNKIENLFLEYNKDPPELLPISF